MTNQTTQSAQTKQTHSKASGGGVPAGWQEACPPQNWRRVKLREVAESIKSGGTPSTKKKEYYSNGNIPWLNTKEINFNRIFDTEIKISETGLKNSSAKWIKENSVVVAMYGATAGKVALIKIPLTTNQACCNITLNKSEADYNYIYYFLSNKYSELVGLSTGAAQQNLNVGIISNFPILLPPLPEQKAIAEVLSSLDDKIDLLHRQNKTLEDMAQALFRKWFVDNPEREGWESGKISDLVKILSGFAFKSKDFVECGKYRLITIKNVQDGYLDLSKASFLEKIPDRMPDYCLLNNGDILLSLTGNVGRCCLVTKKNLLLNQRVAKLQPQNKENWAFVYILFRQAVMRNLLEEAAKGTAQANLSPVETANLPFKIPSQDILDEFSKSVTPLLEKILKNKSQICTLENLRDTLLPKLMSGEVEVKF